MRSESSSSLNSATSGPSLGPFSGPSSPTSTAATSVLGDDDFYVIQNLYVRPNAEIDPSVRQAYESTLRPRIDLELSHGAYGERYVIALCSVGLQHSSFSPAILISTWTSKVKRRIFAHLSGLEDLKVVLKEHNLALHVVIHRTPRSGDRCIQADDADDFPYIIARPDSKALCGSKIVIPTSSSSTASSCTSGPTFLIGGREYGRTALHPWEDDAGVSYADIGSSLVVEEDDESDDGLALSLFPHCTDPMDELESTARSILTSNHDDTSLSLFQTQHDNGSVTSSMLDRDEYGQLSRNGSGRINPIYRGSQTDWILYDAQDAAPNTPLGELTNNVVNGYKITKFHQEDPHAKVAVTIADHEAIVHGYLLPGTVSFRVGSRLYDMRLVTLEYPLRRGCSGAAVTHQEELCGTIQAISEDIPWAYMMPVKAELKEMEAVCGMPVSLSGVEEGYSLGLKGSEYVAAALSRISPTENSADIVLRDIFMAAPKDPMDDAREAETLTPGDWNETSLDRIACNSLPRSLSSQNVHFPLPHDMLAADLVLLLEKSLTPEVTAVVPAKGAGRSSENGFIPWPYLKCRDYEALDFGCAFVVNLQEKKLSADRNILEWLNHVAADVDNERQQNKRYDRKKGPAVSQLPSYSRGWKCCTNLPLKDDGLSMIGIDPRKFRSTQDADLIDVSTRTCVLESSIHKHVRQTTSKWDYKSSPSETMPLDWLSVEDEIFRVYQYGYNTSLCHSTDSLIFAESPEQQWYWLFLKRFWRHLSNLELETRVSMLPNFPDRDSTSQVPAKQLARTGARNKPSNSLLGRPLLTIYKDVPSLPTTYRCGCATALPIAVQASELVLVQELWNTRIDINSESTFPMVPLQMAINCLLRKNVDGIDLRRLHTMVASKFS